MSIRVVIVCFLVVACSGRNAPDFDTGNRGTDAGEAIDAGQTIDAGQAIDAGIGQDAAVRDTGVPCVDGDQACRDDQADSILEPCLPYQEDCERRQLCSDDSVHWCRPGGGCAAAPGCPLGAQQTDYPCGLNEPNCSIQTECNMSIFCRPLVDCAAEPECADGEQSSLVPCGLDETDCNRQSSCGSTVWCRPSNPCNTAARCNRGRPTNYPCVQGEEYCERIRVCDTTVFCRY